MCTVALKRSFGPCDRDRGAFPVLALFAFDTFRSVFPAFSGGSVLPADPVLPRHSRMALRKMRIKDKMFYKRHCVYCVLLT